MLWTLVRVSGAVWGGGPFPDATMTEHLRTQLAIPSGTRKIVNLALNNDGWRILDENWQVSTWDLHDVVPGERTPTPRPISGLPPFLKSITKLSMSCAAAHALGRA